MCRWNLKVPSNPLCHTTLAAIQHSPYQSRPEILIVFSRLFFPVSLSLGLSVLPLTLLQKLLLFWNSHLLLCQNSRRLQKLPAEVSLSNQQHHSRKRNQHAPLVLMYCISVPNLIALQPFLQHLLAAARSSTLSLVLNGRKNWQHAEAPQNTQLSWVSLYLFFPTESLCLLVGLELG